MSDIKDQVSKMLEELDCESFMNEEDAREYYDEATKLWATHPQWSHIVAEVVSSYGGENQGSEYWTVWKFTIGDESVLVKFHGWYASYHGADFTDWAFVEPKQKVVTVYE